MEYLYSLSLALFLTIALIPLLIKVSGRLGLVDQPGAERKVHSSAMPRTGGLGIIIGAALPLLILLPMDGYLRQLFIGCVITVLFGLLDDRVELSYLWKIFGQSLAAIVVMSGGIVLHHLPFLGLSDSPLWLSYPITFLFLVGVVNGVNFSDGLDGLAAGTSIMALLLIFTLAIQSENSAVALISLTLVGGVLGFLRFNTFPANIFMGDAGSQFLGFIIACLAIAVTQSEISPYSAWLPVLILGIPIMDIIQVIPVRIYKKLPLPGPDKEHFHHQVGKLGFSHVEVVAIIYLLQTILMTGAFLLRYESDLAVALFYAGFVITILSALLLANASNWRFRRGVRQPAVENRRNNYLRRFNWYHRHAARLIAVLLGVFFITAGWRLGDYDSIFLAATALAGAFAVSLFVARFQFSTGLFRIILYCVCVFIAYQIATSHIALDEEYWLLGFMLAMVICLVTAIRMTRRQEFALTTQDLLILLVVVLVPLLPIEFLGEYEIGGIALIVAVLMYTSEFVLICSTRMIAFSVACAIAGALLVLPVGK